MDQNNKAARSNKAKKRNRLLIAIVAAVILFDGAIWHDIISARAASVTHDYFLDVGQGDSELIVFPGNIKVMTDAGPTDQVLTSLAYALPPGDDYIDVAIISHPQLDHFNGYNFILDHYHVGVFIYNGRDDDPGVKAWPALKEKIKEKGIPFITLGSGDKILVGDDVRIGATSSKNEIDMLSPNLTFTQSAELNDTGFVELIKTPEFRTLLTADTGFNIENWLVANHADIQADVLKVGHHGSKYSSGDKFLHAVDPRVAVIEVGANNTYGHPGSSTLARLTASTDATIYRTDRNGTVEVWPEDGRLEIKKEK
jgi:competence protein ComEC